MPLVQPLAEFRQNLEAQIRENQLPEALNTLLTQLPDGSETYRIVSVLIARFNAANKERFRNTITFDEYQRRVDQVSADFFDLLDGLTEINFEDVPASAPARQGSAGGKATAGETGEAGEANKGKATKKGSVLYRVPNLMRLQKPSRCTIRVAVDEEAILENIVLDEHVEIKSRIEISDVMSAELLDPVGGTFQISALNSRTQLVRETGYTEWNFNVTPLIEGVHQLLVKVSIMEVVPGFSEPIPREVSVIEMVTIETESASSDDDPLEFKPSGQTFSFNTTSTAQGDYEINYSKSAAPAPPVANRRSSSPGNGIRMMVLFLGILVIAPAVTWAVVPEPTLDWWVTSMKDSPEAYAAYIEEYHNTGSPHLEKAFFYKAEATNNLADLRAYQERFWQSGKFESKVISIIAVHESKSLENIRARPDSLKIRKFVADFPESERLSEVKQAVEARPDKRPELMPVVENAYVTSVKAKPTETKVVAYLNDFPKRERLNEVDSAARAEPEVFQKVQPVLEDAYLKKMEQNPTEAQSKQFLEKFPEPIQKERFEKILEKKPGLKRDAVIKMRRIEAARKARERGQ